MFVFQQNEFTVHFQTVRGNAGKVVAHPERNHILVFGQQLNGWGGSVGQDPEFTQVFGGGCNGIAIPFSAFKDPAFAVA